VKATSIRNWFIAGALSISFGIIIPLTKFQIPAGLDIFTSLEQIRYVIENIGIPVGIVCIAIGLIALYKRKKRQSTE